MALAEDKLLGKQQVSSLRCLLPPLVVAAQERLLLLRFASSSLKFSSLVLGCRVATSKI